MSNQAKNIPEHPVYPSPIVLTFATSVKVEELQKNQAQQDNKFIAVHIERQFWHGPGSKLCGSTKRVAINWAGTPYEDSITKENSHFEFVVIGLRNENSDGTRLFVDAILNTPIVTPGPIIIESHPDADHIYSIDDTGIMPNSEISMFIDTERGLGTILSYRQDSYSVNLTPDDALKIDFDHTPIPACMIPDVKLADLPIKWPDPKPAAPTKPVEPAKPAANTDPDDD